MATGGFPLNKPASSSPATKEVMTKEKDLLMRLIYLTRRTCDQLSRDLTKYVIAELCPYQPYQSSNWDDWLNKWLNDKNINDRQKNNRQKKIAMFFGDKTPTIDKCDTSLLTDMLSKEIIPQTNETFNPYIKRLRTFRNEVSHDELETGVTEPEFLNELDILNNYLLKLQNDPSSQPIFPSVPLCLEFLSQNKCMTFEQFCTYYPDEITTFIHSLEPALRAILKTIPCLTERVNKHEILLEKIQNDLTCYKSSTDNRLEKVETKVENVETELENVETEIENVETKVENVETELENVETELEKVETKLENVETKLENVETELVNLQLTRQMSTQLPSDSFRPYSVSGRQNALDTLETYLDNEQIALIYGPPGIGKTAFANCFGKKFSSETQVSIEVRFDDFNLQQEKTVDLIARKVGCNFPGILAGLEETMFPLSVLENHIRDVLKERKLLLIFDNIDKVINLRDAAGHMTGREALQTVTTKLLPTGEGLKILFTARDQTFDPEPYNCFQIELEPLSQEACEDWLSKQKSQIEKKTLEEISKCCKGIPLILNIFFKFVKRHGRTEEFEKVKRSDDRLKKSLELSFAMLTDDQLIIMLCAAAFNGNFDAETLDSLFIKVKPTYNSDNRNSLIRDCRDLSLCEYDDGKHKYYLHPYIQEFVRETYASESEQKAVDANFVQTYFEKLLSKARQQLVEKDSFCSVVSSLVADSQNIFKFFEILSNDAAPMLNASVSFDEFSAYWLLSFFWLLNKISRFKKTSFELAKKLEKIFIRSKNYAHVIICKCFLSHYLRLSESENALLVPSRTKICEADGLLTGIQNKSILHFCQGYLAFTKARFNQHVSNLVKYRRWKQSFPWESNRKLFNQAFSFYETWSTEVLSKLEQSVFQTMYKSEQIHVFLYQYRDLIPSIKTEQEKSERFQNLTECIKFLQRALGNHEEVAFAVKKLADQLKFNGRKQEATDNYSKAFEMYQVFGPEIEIQQVILLKEWSDCLCPREALKKLRLANQILEQNCMTNHAWYSQIKKRMKKRQNDQNKLMSSSNLH